MMMMCGGGTIPIMYDNDNDDDDRGGTEKEGKKGEKRETRARGRREIADNGAVTATANGYSRARTNDFIGGRRGMLLQRRKEERGQSSEGTTFPTKGTRGCTTARPGGRAVSQH